MVGEDGFVCYLTETHYLVDGTIYATNEATIASRFAFETGVGSNKKIGAATRVVTPT